MAQANYRTLVGACKICGQEFTFRHRTGRHPTICSNECRKQARQDTLSQAPRLSCEVEGCDKMARPGRQPICPMHYHRRYRTGSLDKDEPKHRWWNKHDGYYVGVSADHPLAGKDGVVREHRAVAYDTYGEGPHPCYWCGKSMDWPEICVDHLNSIKTDNSPSNLVVSCNSCNGSRARMRAFIANSLPERREDILSMVEEAFSQRESL